MAPSERNIQVDQRLTQPISLLLEPDGCCGVDQNLDKLVGSTYVVIVCWTDQVEYCQPTTYQRVSECFRNITSYRHQEPVENLKHITYLAIKIATKYPGKVVSGFSN